MTDQRFYGKYRGTVVNNVDPEQTGHLLVEVSDSHGLSISSWAAPCFPIGGLQSGIWAVPAVGSAVWVEFEAGDPDYPIWSGGSYGTAAQVPALALAGLPGSPSIVMQTLGQNTLMISDAPGPAGGILLKTTAGAMISISTAGIVISNGQGATITLTGPTTTVNNGALVVT